MRFASRAHRALSIVVVGAWIFAAAARADTGVSADSVEARAVRLQQVVESLRGLRFLRPVPVRVVSDSVARGHFAARMTQFDPEDELRNEAMVYEHLGLLEPGTDLSSLLLGVLEEQAGGYYDPATQTFYVLGDVPASLLDVILAHELTHALDDQHFDVDSTFTALSRDEDRQAAFGAVVEGSGTLVMSVYVVQAMAAGEFGEESFLDLQASEFGRAAELAAAPEVVRRALLAPYILGMSFLVRGDPAGVAAAVDSGAIDRAFRDPPTSTEQILHPEKYWEPAARDDPRPLPEVDLGSVLGSGWRPVGDGSLGEILVALLTGSEALSLEGLLLALPQSWTNPGASGWGNDRWELWTDGDSFLTLLVTAWDTGEDAAEFVSSLRIPYAQVAHRGDTVVVAVGDGARERGDIAQACLDALVPKPATR